MIKLDTLNTFTTHLPGDKLTTNNRRQVFEACYSLVSTHKPSNPTIIHLSDEMIKVLRLEDVDQESLLAFLSGSESHPDFDSYAMCYGGHQFGHWAGQLGDGRAINIAELATKNKPLTLQLKGSGPTPYSRNADGFAVLRSSIREYLCSEAMHHLGIATTRALSLVLTGDQVMRDVMYNGNPALEPSAIVCRVSRSFLRFGSYEIHSARKDVTTLKTLVDFTMKEYYPELGAPTKTSYLAFFQEVADRTKKMILHWQRVGFVHGVMNTDNMSILGDTIDYGPYGWLEDYNPNWTPNTTDAQNKRYSYGDQPSIGLWNLTQLANSLYPLIEDIPALEKVLLAYRDDFHFSYLQMLLSKIGIVTMEVGDNGLIENLIQLLTSSEIDMTIFYRNLNVFDPSDPISHWENIKSASYLSDEIIEKQKDAWNNWLNQYAERLGQEDTTIDIRIKRMNGINPKYVLRNYMAQLAIEEAEKGSYIILNELFELLKKPYDEQPDMEKWFAKRPEWAREKVGCSMLSCSS